MMWADDGVYFDFVEPVPPWPTDQEIDVAADLAESRAESRRVGHIPARTDIVGGVLVVREAVG